MLFAMLCLQEYQTIQNNLIILCTFGMLPSKISYLFSVTFCE